jgi:uncharacterized protein
VNEALLLDGELSVLDESTLFLMFVSFFLGWLAGHVMHRSDFCIAGMFRDLFVFRQFFMLRNLLLLVVASMILIEIARLLGLLSNYPFPRLGPPSLTALLGGVLFGIGMVLAGGCVVGTLYKMGAGSLLSTLAFLGLIAGSFLYGEIHPLWSALNKKTTLSPQITLSQMLGLAPSLLVAVLAGGAALLFWHWFRQGGWQRPSFAEGYLQPWRAALILALAGLTSYLLVGMPLGVTTAYAKIGALLVNQIFPEHLAQLTFFQGQPLDYIPPLATVPIRGGAGPQFDAIAVIQFPLIAGIILGAAVSALLLGEFRVHFRVPARQAVSALLGGVIMGLASRMAPSCNIWHLMGGLPILAVESILFLLGLLPGAWLGSRLLLRVVLVPAK